MTAFIKIPFAQAGDKTNPPDTDPAGGVNWTQGYGSNYSKDPATDPSAKRIEREYMNGLLNQLSMAINEIQKVGITPWISPADNGGSPVVYPVGSLVFRGSGNWISIFPGGATDEPTNSSTQWSKMLVASNSFNDMTTAQRNAGLINLGFTSGSGWARLPGGMTIQFGLFGFSVGQTNKPVTLPRAFANDNYSVNLTWYDINTPDSNVSNWYPALVAVVSNTKSAGAFQAAQYGSGGFNCNWIAVGASV